MHKLAVLAVCFLLAATVLPGASKAAKKHTAASTKKPGAKKPANGKGSSATTKRSRSGSSARTSPKSKKTAVSSSKSKKTAVSSSKSKKGAVSSKASGKHSARTARRSRRGHSSRSTGDSDSTPAPRSTAQRSPSADRYREIQQALADRGYYRGPVNGEWNPESVDALKRYQKEQNLSGNGKLDSLSLISLGLGPKRDPNALGGPGTTGSTSPATTSPKEPLQP